VITYLKATYALSEDGADVNGAEVTIAIRP